MMKGDLMRKRQIWPLSLTLMLPLLTAANPVVAGTDHARVVVDSQILQESRSLRVRLPQDYEGSQNRYPVLYLLDGEWSFEKFSPVVESLIEDESIPDLIIVAVENVDEHSRLWDFTPTQVEKYPGSGGAESFLLFIQNELVPFVDDAYRTTQKRIICGHSLAGLMSAYSFLNSPDLFEGSIASSPSFSWDNQLMVRSLEGFLKQGGFQDSFIYLAIGSDDFPTYIDAMAGAVDIMEEEAPEGLRWEYMLYQSENHETVPDHSFPDGLKLFFNN